ncbi:hypothetical protein MKX01_030544 [Papaver californicum]|nr:hypothetical protein MKX01_030544 [Papaver californicum]
MGDKALEIYDILVDEYSSFPTVFACNGLLYAVFRFRRFSGIDIARQVYDEMLKRNECDNNFVDNHSTGFVPTLFTYGAIINGLCSTGDFEKIDEIISKMNANGLSGGVEIYNNIIDSRFNHRFVVEAVECLNKMIERKCEPDITTYSIMISGLCKVGKVHEAYGFLGKAVEKTIETG